jgi:hypothetical protein
MHLLSTDDFRGGIVWRATTVLIVNISFSMDEGIIYLVLSKSPSCIMVESPKSAILTLLYLVSINKFSCRRMWLHSKCTIRTHRFEVSVHYSMSMAILHS